MIREIVLDTETTGIDHNRGHRLIEIGCVELVDYRPSGRTFHEYVNPERDVEAGAFEVHGISTESLLDKPLFADVAESFLEFIGDAQLIIHNAKFDMGFINMELDRLGMDPLPMSRSTDTLMLARKRNPGGPNSLDALCRRFKITSFNRDLHGALLDSEILAEVYLHLIGGEQSELGLRASSGKQGARDDVMQTNYGARVNTLPSRLTEDERAAHAAFIEKLGEDALWKKFGTKTEPV